MKKIFCKLTKGREKSCNFFQYKSMMNPICAFICSCLLICYIVCLLLWYSMSVCLPIWLLLFWLWSAHILFNIYYFFTLSQRAQPCLSIPFCLNLSPCLFYLNSSTNFYFWYSKSMNNFCVVELSNWIFC